MYAPCCGAKCRLLALSGQTDRAGFVAHWGNNGHRPALALNGLVANDL